MTEPPAALEWLASIAQRREALEREELDCYTAARKAGVTWRQVAERAGYRDRRGAYMRYKTLRDRYG